VSIIAGFPIFYAAGRWDVALDCGFQNHETFIGLI
jgi:hypothetical protein